MLYLMAPFKNGFDLSNNFFDENYTVLSIKNTQNSHVVIYCTILRFYLNNPERFLQFVSDNHKIYFHFFVSWSSNEFKVRTVFQWVRWTSQPLTKQADQFWQVCSGISHTFWKTVQVGHCILRYCNRVYQEWQNILDQMRPKTGLIQSIH